MNIDLVDLEVEKTVISGDLSLRNKPYIPIPSMSGI